MLCLSSISTVTYSESNILIITSADSKYQQRLSSTIKTELSKTHLKPVFTETDTYDKNTIASHELIIALAKDSITLHSRNSHDPASQNTTKRSSIDDDTLMRQFYETKIHMTQPQCRQFRLIKTLHPDWKTVGLLLSANNDMQLNTLSTCGHKYGLTASAVTIDNNTDLVAALNTVLTQSDVLLSLPDVTIYNSRTIKNILLTSYRHRIPIIGFSESFANAGAIAAVHTSAEQLGQQVVDLVRNYFENRKQPDQSEYYPSDFSVTTNQQVARSLGIKIEDSKTIEFDLKRMESGSE